MSHLIGKQMVFRQYRDSDLDYSIFMSVLKSEFEQHS